MILNIISSIKQSVNVSSEIETQRLVAINNIEELLNQIDFSSEVVQTHDKEKLTKLLSSLKGKSLNKQELALVEDITKF